MQFPFGYAYRNSFRWVGVATLFIAFVALGAMWSKFTIEAVELSPHPYNSWRCETVAGGGAARPLRVLGMSRGDKKDVEKLCESSGIARLYSGVELRWKSDDEARDATFLEMKYDVLAVKPSRLHDEETGALGSYSEVAQYGPYECYLIGRGETPRLDASYFNGKRLGLGEPLSESSRRVLLGQLPIAGIDVNSLDCQGIAGHTALRDAFEAGEIDVFSSYWEEGDSRRFPDARLLLLKDVVKPVTWYVRSDLMDTAVHCEIIAMLESKARNSDRTYFKSLSVVRPCRN